MMSEPAEPPLWNELIRIGDRMMVRNSCWSLPALRQTRVAVFRCSPVQHEVRSLAEALSTFLTKLKSLRTTLPDPPPPPLLNEPEFVPPKLHDSTSISPLCLSSVDSPSTLSIFRK